MDKIVRFLGVGTLLVAAGCRSESQPEATAPAQTASAPAAPAAPATPPAAEPSREVVLRRFHQLWYDDKTTWQKNRWLGIPNQQNPMDMWIVQEILFETKPDFIVECGSWFGGSAVMWAMLLEQINPNGRVITIDIEDRLAEAKKLPIFKKKVDFILGSSTDPKVVADVKKRVGGKKVMLLLDSNHERSHVLNELNAYWELVPVGGYINVQDTNVNGNPVALAHGPGPFEATREFLATNDRFMVDVTRERLLFTFHPSGWLRRVK